MDKFDAAAANESAQTNLNSSETSPEDFVVRLDQALHKQGMVCHHLESLLGRVTERLGLTAHMLSLPTPLCQYK